MGNAIRKTNVNRRTDCKRYFSVVRDATQPRTKPEVQRRRDFSTTFNEMWDYAHPTITREESEGERCVKCNGLNDIVYKDGGGHFGCSKCGTDTTTSYWPELFGSSSVENWQ